MKLRFIVSFLLFFCCYPQLQATITYQFSSGRLGDNLLSYLHAKWIAYKQSQTLLYRPFPYSEKFVFHNLENSIAGNANLQNSTILAKGSFHNMNLNNDMAYQIPYFSDFEHEYPGGYFAPGSTLAVDWNDPAFKKIVYECIAPVERLAHVIHPPETCVSVALHVRKGGRHETWHLKCDQLKFPPNSFFAEQLAFVCQAYAGHKIYAFLFTDDLNPGAIAEEIALAVSAYDVTIDYRRSDTSDTTFVLDDFFSLPLFNVLIRPCSNFSYVAGKLGNYLLEISPKKYSIIDGNVKIIAVDVAGKGYYI